MDRANPARPAGFASCGGISRPYVFVVTVAAVDVFEADAVLLLPLPLDDTAALSGRNPLPLRLRLAIV
jgi:hypothetical protein